MDGFDELADLVEVGQAELDKALMQGGGGNKGGAARGVGGLSLGNLSQKYGVDLTKVCVLCAVVGFFLGGGCSVVGVYVGGWVFR